jgi:hypothetical protein
MRLPRNRSWIVPALAIAALAAVLACATSSQEIHAEGRSEVTVTATSHVGLKATGPMTFPSRWPAIGGMQLAAGETIDIDLDPGESVTLKDRVTYNGQTVIISSANQTDGGLRPTSRLVAVPAPLTYVQLTGQIEPGSTYTWTIPSLLGDNEAEVQVTGSASGKALTTALVQTSDGSWTLNPAGLVQFSYQVTGGPAVWQAPLDTPYGRIEGTGTIATDGGLVFEFTGDLDGVSAGGTEGYVDEDGNVFDFGYSGAFPVRLTAGGGTATGATTVWGGFDAS